MKNGKVITSIATFFICFVGIYLSSAVGIEAALVFWAIIGVGMAILSFYKPIWPMHEKYRGTKIEQNINKMCGAVVLGMSIICVIVALLMHLKPNPDWILILLVYLGVMLIIFFCIDRKYKK